MKLPYQSRRHFLQSVSLAGAALALPPALRAAHHQSVSHPMAGRLYKTLKIGMIKIEASLIDKFKAAREAGFMGVEMN